MGLGYNKNVLYPRPITLAKDICGFIGVIGITCLIQKNSQLVYHLLVKSNLTQGRSQVGQRGRAHGRKLSAPSPVLGLSD